MGYFRSLIILASFFGMGLGCILLKRIRLSDGALINIFLAGICCLFLIMTIADDDLRVRGFGKMSGIIQQGSQIDIPVLPDFTMEFEGDKSKGDFVVIGVFIFISVLFIPVGLIIARLFESLAPIHAYALNIGGALLGTLIFIPISFARIGPDLKCGGAPGQETRFPGIQNG